MPLNEDALNRIKSEVFEREKAAYAFDGKPLQWQQGFTKAFDEAFKAAYSPEVLQALGVVLCDSKPEQYQVKLDIWQNIPIARVDEFNAERYAIRSLHAIKEQS